jgi:hypothetical protein
MMGLALSEIKNARPSTTSQSGLCGPLMRIAPNTLNPRHASLGRVRGLIANCWGSSVIIPNPMSEAHIGRARAAPAADRPPLSHDADAPGVAG